MFAQFLKVQDEDLEDEVQERSKCRRQRRSRGSAAEATEREDVLQIELLGLDGASLVILDVLNQHRGVKGW